MTITGCEVDYLEKGTAPTVVTELFYPLLGRTLTQYVDINLKLRKYDEDPRTVKEQISINNKGFKTRIYVIFNVLKMLVQKP